MHFGWLLSQGDYACTFEFESKPVVDNVSGRPVRQSMSSSARDHSSSMPHMQTPRMNVSRVASIMRGLQEEGACVKSADIRGSVYEVCPGHALLQHTGQTTTTIGIVGVCFTVFYLGQVLVFRPDTLTDCSPRPRYRIPFTVPFMLCVYVPVSNRPVIALNFVGLYDNTAMNHERYTDGELCAAVRPMMPRSARVTYVCGAQKAVRAVTETSTCVFEVEVVLPFVCGVKEFEEGAITCSEGAVFHVIGCCGNCVHEKGRRCRKFWTEVICTCDGDFVGVSCV